ncbi:MAG: hypothetical protein QOE88_2409 [Verrucomicrobiota bacterium]|nr:hypothetical protein [Verrucomicrobiota bacterium]
MSVVGCQWAFRKSLSSQLRMMISPVSVVRYGCRNLLWQLTTDTGNFPRWTSFFGGLIFRTDGMVSTSG